MISTVCSCPSQKVRAVQVQRITARVSLPLEQNRAHGKQQPGSHGCGGWLVGSAEFLVFFSAENMQRVSVGPGASLQGKILNVALACWPSASRMGLLVSGFGVTRAGAQVQSL